jgi:hypothetical protein
VTSSARELRVEGDVAEAAGDDAAVEPLVPVVEAVPAVVRDLEQHLLDRLRRDHLATRRDDQALELAEQPTGIAVRWRRPYVRVDLVDRADSVCSWISTPAAAGRSAMRRTSRAGWSTPSGGWKSAAG